jgi:hypothetical protein
MIFSFGIHFVDGRKNHAYVTLRSVRNYVCLIFIGAFVGFDSRRRQNFYLFLIVKTDPSVHPVSYPMGTGALYQRVKLPKLKADHLPLYSPGVKEDGAIPLIPTCLHGRMFN